MKRKRTAKATQSGLCYSPDELAQLLGVHRAAVYRGVREDRIPHIRLGRRVLLPKEAINNWLRTGRDSAAA